jgi:hypothetical protein
MLTEILIRKRNKQIAVLIPETDELWQDTQVEERCRTTEEQLLKNLQRFKHGPKHWWR